MTRTRFFLAITLAAAFALPAQADTFTTQRAQINQSIVNSGSPLVNFVNQISGTNNLGAVYENNISTTGTPAVGNVINIIGADRVTGYIANPGGNVTANFNGRDGVAVFAIQAHVTSTATMAGQTVAATIAIDKGAVGLFSSAGFQAQNLSSWGFNNTAGLASWTLGPNATVNTASFPPFQGDPLAAQFPPIIGGVNQNTASVDTLNSSQNQGRLLLLDGKPQQFVTVNNPVIDPGQQLNSQGLQGTFTEQIQNPFGNFNNTNNTNLQLANQIFNTLLGTNFATFGTGAATDFTPGNLSAGLTADLNANFGFSAFPVIGEGPIQNVGIPEPAAVLLWGVVLGGAGLYGRSRLRKAS
jgi:hypothetical protein